MLPITHILAPIVALRLYGLWRGVNHSYRTVLLVGFFGVLPDLVNPHIALAERASWSHSALLLPVIGLAAILLADRLQKYARLLLGAFSIHLLFDTISNPYNFLYPLDFSYGTDLYPECVRMGIPVCWYGMDVLLLIVFLLIETYRD
ncbi:MAG: metal-dependent hydrolase [Candidatus Nanohaloarchaea archaeon]|nr:metal-dependent hydrolase [Candidatus Nanohaloarchaea archaeon]